MKSSAYMDAFKKVFGSGHSFGPNFETFNITGMGPSNGLTLYLDAHTLTGKLRCTRVRNSGDGILDFFSKIFLLGVDDIDNSQGVSPIFGLIFLRKFQWGPIDDNSPAPGQTPPHG